MEDNKVKREQILVSITGVDRPGLTASIMDILAQGNAQILDIGQSDIHSTVWAYCFALTSRHRAM